MIYGYIRVSTDKQTVENQRYEIQKFCQRERMRVDVWIEETISGTKDFRKRRLGKTLTELVKGDVLICSELSRLGRSLFMIMDILNICLQNECKVYSIKDNYRLGDDIQSKVLAFAFGLSAEIERNLISQRTKEALECRRKEGIILGRPVGRKSSKTKLTGKEQIILSYFSEKKSKSWISKSLGVHRNTLEKFIKEKGLRALIVIEDV